jgi:DNA-binding XRE family transcriptional regulator
MGSRRTRLEALMQQHRYNHTTLARDIGIDRTTLSHIVAGRDTSVRIALAIARKLDSTVEEIFLP